MKPKFYLNYVFFVKSLLVFFWIPVLPLLFGLYLWNDPTLPPLNPAPKATDTVTFQGKRSGASDDTEALLQALEQSIQTRSKTLYIPNGRYEISKEVILDQRFSGLKILGESKASIFVLSGPHVGTLFKISDFQSTSSQDIWDIEMGHLTLIGNKNNSDAISGFGIDTFMNSSGKIRGLKIHDIEAYDFITNGIQLENCYDTVVSNIYSHHNGVHGLGIKTGSYTISQIIASQNDQLGIDFAGTKELSFARADKIQLTQNAGGGGKSAGFWDLHIESLITRDNGKWGFYKTHPTHRWYIQHFVSENNRSNGLFFGSCDGKDQLEIHQFESINDNIDNQSLGGSLYIPKKAGKVSIGFARIEKANGRALTLESPNVGVGELEIFDPKSKNDFPFRIQEDGGGTFEKVTIRNGNFKAYPFGLFIESRQDILIRYLHCADTRRNPIMTKGVIIGIQNQGKVSIEKADFVEPHATAFVDRTNKNRIEKAPESLN